MEAAIAERMEQFLAAVAAEEGGPPNGSNGVDVQQELTELILDGRSIRSITAQDAEALKKFCNLTKLTLNQTGLASLANLPCMTSVRTLEATDNHITTGLDLLVKAFPNLRKLQLGGNHIKTFEDLESLVTETHHGSQSRCRAVERVVSRAALASTCSRCCPGLRQAACCSALPVASYLTEAALGFAV